MKNRKIDIKSLLKAIFLKWPALLAALLVFGLIGCGKYYKDNHNSSSVRSNTSETEKKDSSDKDYNQSQKEAIDREIQWLNQFIDETPANKINSYKAGYASSTLYVSGGDGQISGRDIEVLQIDTNDNNMSKGDKIQEVGIDSDPETNMVMESLKTFLESGIDWSSEKKKYNVPEDAYLYDLMNVRISGNVLTISYWYDTPENARAVLDDVVKQINNQFEKIKDEESLNGYSLKETAGGSTTKVIDDSDNWITRRITQLKNLATSIESSNAVKTSDSSISSIGSAQSSSFSTKAMIKSGIKYGIVGLVLMAFILMIWILKKGFVLSDDEFQANTGIHELGTVGSKKREIDIENLNETITTQFSDYKDIALVTDENDIEFLNEINNSHVVKGLLTDKKVREDVRNYDSAIIFLKKNNSKYSDLDEIIKVLKSRGITILGFISC